MARAMPVISISRPRNTNSGTAVLSYKKKGDKTQTLYEIKVKPQVFSYLEKIDTTDILASIMRVDLEGVASREQYFKGNEEKYNPLVERQKKMIETIDDIFEARKDKK